MKTIIVTLVICFLYSCPDNAQKNKDLVAYWSFDDSSSTKITESGGSGLVTINKGAKHVKGFIGNAMEFNGSSVLFVEYSPILDAFSKGITVAAWIKKDNATHWNTVLSREIDSTKSEYMGLAVFKNHALFSIDPNGKKYIKVTDTASIIPDKWVHLSGTYDNDTLRLYVNGRKINSTFQKGPIFFRDKNPLIIGGNSNDKNHTLVDCFKGCIDELRIYNRALSEKEIKSLINQ